MAITLNLTAVLITAIICLTLCFICKMGQATKAGGKKSHGAEQPQRYRTTKPIQLMTYEEMQQAKKEMEQEKKREGKTE